MTQKKFADFVSQKCEGCQHYWNSTCDGQTGDDCKSFEATKMTYLEDKLNLMQRNQLTIMIGMIVYGLIEVYQMIRTVLV